MNPYVDFQTCESKHSFLKMSKTFIENDEEVKEVPKMADPDQRLELPFFKDPKIKISLWTILKESIGKDISKITVPVFFNQPLNIL